MAKVEMFGGPAGGSMAGSELFVTEYSGGVRVPVNPFTNEYADKVWEECTTFSVIEELVSKRKVIQRKLDAARKKLKRLASRLNTIERSWNPA